MANAPLGHPGADRLADYRLGRLAGDEAAVVEGHLNGCAACRALLDALSQETLARLATTDTGTPEAAAKPAADGPVQALPVRIGPYRVERLLGRGGMGAVYLAHDDRLDRAVAVKVPRLEAGADCEAAERFRREARAAATIEHPNVCPVYEVGEDAGVPYLAMRFVEGKPLSDVLRGGRRLPPRQAAALAAKVALALQAAHQRGVVHRDLKPANIMLAGGREPVVMDFGLARQPAQGETRLTQSGTILGTPAYMSPEQVAADASAVGPATDVYSLGVILYEMLTGRLPFDGPLAAVLGQILTADPPSVAVHRPDLDPPLVGIVQRAMARKPADRFASMAEVASALAAYVRATGPGAPTAMVAPAAAAPAPAGDVVRWPARLRRSVLDVIGMMRSVGGWRRVIAYAGAGAAVGLVVVGVALGVYSWSHRAAAPLDAANQVVVPLRPGGAGPSGSEEGLPVAVADAGKHAARQGDVQVEVAGIELPRGVGGELVIRLRILGVDGRHRVEFTGWGDIRGGHTPRLHDLYGNEYAHVGGESQARTLQPGESATDVLVFERLVPSVLDFNAPADPSQALRLELPGDAFGGTGQLCFEIPRRMLVLRLAPAVGARAARAVADLLTDEDGSVRLEAVDVLGRLGEPGVPHLASALTNAEPAVRAAAARTLARVGQPARPALPALVLALGDPSADVGREVAAALKAVGPPLSSDRPALREALKNPRAAVRLYALQALVALNAEDIGPLCVAALRDEVKDVRLLAAGTLGALGEAAGPPAYGALVKALRDGDAEVRRAAFAALKAFRPPPAEIPGLLAQVREGAEPRRYALYAVGRLGPEAVGCVAALADALRDEDADLRGEAAGALGRVGPAAAPAVPALAALLDDKDSRVTRAAATALAGIGAPAVPAVGRGLDSPRDAVRAGAAGVAERIGAPARSLAPQLVKLLRDEAVPVRAKAASALGRVGADKGVALPPLADALKDPAVEVRREVVQAIAEIGPDAPVLPALFVAMEDDDPGVSREARAALGRAGPPGRAAVPALRKALDSRKADVRAYAAAALGQVGADAGEAAPDLQRALQDMDKEVREAAARALAAIGGQAGGASAVVTALEDQDEQVARTAAETLEHQRLAKADVPPLLKALRSPKPGVRLAAARALARIGPDAKDAVPALLQTVNDGDDKVRVQAIAALGAMGSEAWAAAKPLAQVLDDAGAPAEVRGAAAAAIGKLGSSARFVTASLVKAVRKKELRDAASDALVALGAVGVPDILEPLQERKNNPYRFALIAILERIGPKAREAVPLLSDIAATDQYGTVRAAARAALAQIEKKD